MTLWDFLHLHPWWGLAFLFTTGFWTWMILGNMTANLAHRPPNKAVVLADALVEAGLTTAQLLRKAKESERKLETKIK